MPKAASTRSGNGWLSTSAALPAAISQDCLNSTSAPSALVTVSSAAIAWPVLDAVITAPSSCTGSAEPCR